MAAGDDMAERTVPLLRRPWPVLPDHHPDPVVTTQTHLGGSDRSAQVLAFFRPVVYEPVMLSSALRRMASERAWSVTTRETVSAPIRVNAATIARLLASSGVPSARPPARASTSFKNPAVAAARV